ncbi:MAG: BASS family bile acid:Na+ symporter [Flavobacteriales bacterium]
MFTTPLAIQFAISQFDNNPTKSFSLLSTTLGLIVITLLPVLLGIFLRHTYPKQAISSEPFFRRLATSFLIFMVISITYQERTNILESLSQVLLPSITLNLVAIATGVILGVAFKLVKRDCVTLGIEIGVQDSGMAILIAVTFLDRPDYAITAGVYALTMYLGAGLLIFGAKRWPE